MPHTSTDISVPVTPVLPPSRAPAELPPLENGDHLDQKTFHERYCAMPEDFRAELVEGMVIVSSPIKLPHGRHHIALMGCLFTYQAATPGTDAVDNTTVILGDESEPQPDGSLYILPEFGGQCRIVDDYLVGAPEWLGEVASSSEAYDLHGKYRDYQRAGAREYVVMLVREQVIRGFVLRGGQFEPITPDAAGVYRSEVFPGLWLDANAFFRNDAAAVLATLQQGLQSPEHGAFVRRLQEQNQTRTT